MKKNILIGSCGGLTATYIAKQFQNKYFEYNIYGIDIDKDKVLPNLFEKVIEVPRVNASNYVEELISVLNEYRIDAYIPTLSSDYKVISQNLELLNKQTKIIVSPFETIDELEDKEKAIVALNKIGIDTPKQFKNKMDVVFPIFIKPKIGSGSKGAEKIEDFENLRFKDEKKFIFSEFLVGTEYTIDCYFDKNGTLITYNQRIREKTLGGAVVITKNDYLVDFKDIIEKISKNFIIKGPANFQFFFTNNGRKVLTDINLRFASGGLPLSIESGADILKLLLLDLFDEKYEKEDYQSDKKNRRMYRYFEESYEIVL